VLGTVLYAGDVTVSKQTGNVYFLKIVDSISLVEKSPFNVSLGTSSQGNQNRTGSQHQSFLLPLPYFSTWTLWLRSSFPTII
jgi:hypothetical protein